MKLSRGTRGSLVATLALSIGALAEAAFPSTETFLPAVGRVPGQGGAQFYTTVWATNLTAAPQTMTFEFLKQGQANPSPAKFTDSLAAGETKVYENVIETKLGLNNAVGAARVTSSGEIFVSERIYNQPPGADLGDTEGLFFAGVPKAFSISAAQSASIQGIDQGASENFRYNFALVETGGGSPTVNVQVFDGSGAMLGQKSYPLGPYEQLQPNVADVVAGIKTTNARITATVTGGTGSVLLAGAQLANLSQDSSGFEMTFRDDLLGQGSAGGVTSLNGLTGALRLTAGSGISVSPSGNAISIAFTGGGGSGITSVTHDASLTGAGTGASPLAIANGQVVRSVNGLHDAVTLAAGSNVTITPSGSTLTIASSGGGGGGLTLPFSGSASTTDAAFQVTNPNTSGVSIESILGDPSEFSIQNAAVLGNSSTKAGVIGQSDSNVGVFGESASGVAVYGETGTTTAVAGQSGTGIGVVALSSGTGLANPALRAISNGAGIAEYATNNSTDSTLVLGNSNSGGDLIKGFGGGAVSPQFEVKASGAVLALSFNGNGNDFADRLPSEAGLAPGDVVAIGPDGKLRRTTRASETDVAGVYSTQPSMVAGLEKTGVGQVPLAVAGVIPVQVTTENGPIHPGDLLVSSSVPGRAMKAPAAPAPGTVIGKAMQTLESGRGAIGMLVMLR